MGIQISSSEDGKTISFSIEEGVTHDGKHADLSVSVTAVPNSITWTSRLTYNGTIAYESNYQYDVNSRLGIIDAKFGGPITGLQSLRLRISPTSEGNSGYVEGSINSRPILPFAVSIPSRPCGFEGPCTITSPIEFVDGRRPEASIDVAFQAAFKVLFNQTNKKIDEFISLEIGKPLVGLGCWSCTILCYLAEMGCLVACPATGPAAVGCALGCVVAAILCLDYCWKNIRRNDLFRSNY